MSESVRTWRVACRNFSLSPSLSLSLCGQSDASGSKYRARRAAITFRNVLRRLIINRRGAGAERADLFRAPNSPRERRRNQCSGATQSRGIRPLRRQKSRPLNAREKFPRKVRRDGLNGLVHSARVAGDKGGTRAKIRPFAATISLLRSRSAYARSLDHSAERERERNLHFLIHARASRTFDRGERTASKIHSPRDSPSRGSSRGIDASRKRLRERRGPPTGS